MGCGASKKKSSAQEPKDTKEESKAEEPAAETAGGPTDSDKTILYSTPICPFSHRIQIALGLKGVEFEIKNVPTPRPDWFLELNEKGEVPVLSHMGRVMTDSQAIIQYLDSQLPGHDLRSTDSSFVETRDKGLDVLGQLSKATMQFLFCKSPALVPERRANFEAVYEKLEGLIQGPYFAGPALTVLDCAFFPWTERWAPLQHYRHYTLPEDKYPKIYALYRTLLENKVFADTKFPEKKVEMFKKGLVRKARPGPVSTMVLTHTAFRLALAKIIENPSAPEAKAIWETFSKVLSFHSQQEDKVLFSFVKKLPATEEGELDAFDEQHERIHSLQSAVDSAFESGNEEEIKTNLGQFNEAQEEHLGAEEKVMMPKLGPLPWEEQVDLFSDLQDVIGDEAAEAVLRFTAAHLPPPGLEVLCHSLTNYCELKPGKISRDTYLKWAKESAPPETWAKVSSLSPELQLDQV